MSNNDYILEAVKGEPGSLTSIAFNTGVIAERQRILRLLEDAYLESRTVAHPLMTRAYAFEQIIRIVKEGCNE